jgi:hypothetical protein
MSGWGQTEKNSVEQMSSGLPLKAALAQLGRNFVFVPTKEVGGSNDTCPTATDLCMGRVSCEAVDF